MNKKLIKAVLRQLGGGKEARETLQDVVNHGANNGFSGFTYYFDTVSFFKKNKKEIVELAEEMAQDLGEDIITMMSGFSCIKNSYNPSEIGKVLYGKASEEDYYIQIANAMAWFALEEVAHFETEKEEQCA